MLHVRVIASLFILLSVQLYALSLDEIIDKALIQNPSLESITYKIGANKSSINVSNQFANPTLTYAQNTIDANEAMSQKTLTLQQKIPFYGKRDALKNVSVAEEKILHVKLLEAKINLVNAIKNQAYSIWELEELLKIIENYIDFTKQKIDLSQSYTSTADNQHMGIMSAELTLSDLKIKISELNAKIVTAYAKLSYLASFEIENLDLSLHVRDLKDMDTLQKSLKNNSSLHVKETEIQKSETLYKSADLDNYPDIVLLAGYAYRENFDNFFNFGVGISLPIYGSEDYKQERARQMSLVAKSLKQDTKIVISSEFKTAYAQMKSAYEIYHIIQDEALPQIEHMFELSDASISTGGDLFKYIDILTQKLKLEQKSVAAVALFNRSNAKLAALSGELK
jgi:outer membrane protein TolC